MDRPFLTRNENPITRLYGPPSGGGVLAETGTGLRVRVWLDMANQSFEQGNAKQRLILDGETWTTQLGVAYRWESGWVMGVQVPWVSHRTGSFDGFIEDYHDALSLPQGNRKRRENYQIDYVYRQGPTTVFRLNEAAEGLGDIRFALSAPLWRQADARRQLDGLAGIELPTGDADLLLGSDTTDLHLGLAWLDRDSLKRWDLVWRGAAGLLAMTTGGPMKEHQRPAAIVGSLSVDWEGWEWIVPRIQLDANSPLFEDVKERAFRPWAVVLVAGASIRLPSGFSLDMAISEDVVVSASPDVVFHLAMQKLF